MSKRKRRIVEKSKASKADTINDFAAEHQNLLFRINKVFITLIVIFFGLSCLGAGLKYLEEDAKRQIESGDWKNGGSKEQSLIDRLNPFFPTAQPSPSPQMSKEYIYAGSRLLAVEDANASITPPADLAVWRPSTGVWWVMGGQSSQQVAVQWGLSTDKPAPGDYDGDGKTDFSVFRPSEGTWYVQRSSDNTLLSYNFGINGDRIAPADYDGDGRTDAAVFRPSDGMWYILRSSDSGVTYQAFGVSTDLPSSADYDGDGKADIAVWRASNTSFYSLASNNQTLQTSTFVQAGNEPVSADYDGDGRADYAIRNGADWIIKQSSNNFFQTISWNQATDKAVQNDYDGDGKVDIAVWRDSTGTWYIRKSGAGCALRQEQWGQSGDVPVPAFYRR